MRDFCKFISVSAVTAMAVFICAANANGQELASAGATKPLALRSVMERLGRDMQSATGAISKEEWAAVAELAPKIANHAEPPASEKIRIVSWLGSEAGKFRSFDKQAHEAASAMGEAAKRRDGQAVIAAFSRVQQSCLGCHQSFRSSFVENFYGSR
jgi:cytochrome c556